MAVNRKFFEYKHLPPVLAEVSKSIGDLVDTMDKEIPTPSAEKEAGMRKLLEAKDCFVRAKLTQGV